MIDNTTGCYDHVWETVYRNDYEKTQRMTVAGGFLYRTMIWGDETSPPSVMMTFVPVTKPEK